jgi:hypothetical protein
MCAVRRAERVVYVDVRKPRQRGSQLGIVGGLAGLVADVLEHQHVAWSEVPRERLHVLANYSRRHRHVGAGQLCQAVRHRAHRQLRLAVLRTAEVRDEHKLRSPIPQLLDRRQGCLHASVVSDRTALERDVEVDPDQYPFSVKVP